MGYVREDSLIYMTEQALEDRDRRRLAVVDVYCADVMSLPAVQGVCLNSLVSGSLVETLSGCEEPGWTKVRLINGKEGYMRTQHLERKRFREEYLWKDANEVEKMLETASSRAKTAMGGQDGFSLKKVLDQWYGGSEEAFRDSLVEEAMKYMGVQYRWGGKSPRGIDCSGLASMAYMRSGVLIYRDASIVDGFPVTRLSVSDALEGKLRKGDLLYFPGHVAIYMENGRFIHSTARAGSGGVVVNSLRSSDPDCRPDLVECLYAAGGVR
ncbi:MAG: NlpC/P60 family protein [Lachnospiraceae bacterium]|nr:NlpC/P60 family protein [Lachnospiraceae bacterium]